MTPEEQYDKAMKELDVKPGDLVVIEKKVDSEFGGWDNTWVDWGDIVMDKYIGFSHKVISISNIRSGIEIESIGMSPSFYFPPYCMRKAIEKEIKEYEERKCSE